MAPAAQASIAAAQQLSRYSVAEEVGNPTPGAKCLAAVGWRASGAFGTLIGSTVGMTSLSVAAAIQVWD
jgi:hypothetical protein